MLALLTQGLRNKQTADRMGISEVTVKVHRHNLMEKMQAGSVPLLISMIERLRAALGDLPDSSKRGNSLGMVFKTRLKPADSGRLATT